VSAGGWIEGLKAAGIILGFIGTVLTLTTTWWLPAYRRWRAHRQALAQMPATLATLATSFAEHREFVDHELRPNNSSSMRDAIDRTERLAHETNNRVNVAIGMIRHAADSNPAEGTFEADHTGSTVWVSATYLRWTGLQLADATGWGWINAVAHADRERLREEWSVAVQEQRVFTSTYRLTDAEGHAFDVEVKANPIRDAQGRVVKWMGNVTRPLARPATAA
jgi:PAS domain S-box-containing protein